jgi:hypothetical protein
MAYTDRELLARTLQAEAGNQGRSGMLAAGSVIMNRAQTSGYGDGVRGVIMKPGQFSAWNSVTGYAGGEQGQDMAAMTPSGDAYSAADALIGGQYSDPTGGATHYYNPSISQPSWGIGNGGDWARIGDHVFGNADAGRGNTPARASTRNAQPPNTRNAPTGGILSNEGNQMAQPQQPQRPQGLLGSMGIQRRDPNAQGETSQPFYNRQSFGDTLARLAPALGRMGVMGLEVPMQAQLDTRNERQGDERAQAMLDTQRNQTREWIATQPNGEQFAAMFDAVGGDATLKAMQAANAPAPTSASFEGLRQQALAGGLVEGTPEFENFILNGPDPSNYRALKLQAEGAGLVEGTPEFERFMMTRGAYDTAFDKATGGNIANVETGGDAAAAVARGAVMGTANAEDAIKLRTMERNMPALIDVVDRLDELSGIASFSKLDILADNARRASGNEVSAGGIARAEYIARVDNVILPLLKATFGAAFTEGESDRLRATLGNEDGTPAERRATLDAFIEQKRAEIRSYRSGGGGSTDDISDEELRRMYGGGG